MSPALVVMVCLLFVSVSLAEAATSCHYGDARDHYFARPFDYDDKRRDESSPFPADKCRLAKEMKEEIQYLRTLMDKCDRCEVPEPLKSCQSGPEGCFESTSCIITTSGRFCGPCPVGYDGNGTSGGGCTKRRSICS